MGYIAHDVVVMVTSEGRPGGLPDIEAFRQSLPEKWRRLVIGPVRSVINFDHYYVAFLPDGSKEGWDDSDAGDDYRARFIALFQQQYDDGSSHDQGVAITFGGDHDYDHDFRPLVRPVGGRAEYADASGG